MSKIAVIITDGDPDDCNVTAVILMDDKDYPVYEDAARMCYGKSKRCFPDLLDEVLDGLNNMGLKFEVIKDIKNEYGYYHFGELL
jgi:hypothetical protein